MTKDQAIRIIEAAFGTREGHTQDKTRIMNSSLACVAWNEAFGAYPNDHVEKHGWQWWADTFREIACALDGTVFVPVDIKQEEDSVALFKKLLARFGITDEMGWSKASISVNYNGNALLEASMTTPEIDKDRQKTMVVVKRDSQWLQSKT